MMASTKFPKFSQGLEFNSNLTLNQLSLDDCSIIAPLIFPTPFGFLSEAHSIVLVLDGNPSTPDQRRKQVEDIDALCRKQLSRGLGLQPATYPHELAAAWLIWVKATDAKNYDNIRMSWSAIVGNLGDSLDYHGRCDLLEFTSTGADAWHRLVSSYDSDTLNLHRDITARVYPKTRLWSPCNADHELIDLNTRFGSGFKSLTAL